VFWVFASAGTVEEASQAVDVVIYLTGADLGPGSELSRKNRSEGNLRPDWHSHAALGDSAGDGGQRRLSDGLSGSRAAARAHVRAAGRRTGRFGAGGVHHRLLSTLDSVLNAPLPDLVLPLPIDNRFKCALLEREGVLGAVLDTVTAYESGQWRGSDADGAVGAAGDAAIQKAFWDATEYARSMLGTFMRGGAPEADPPDGHEPGQPAPSGAARGPQPEQR